VLIDCAMRSASTCSKVVVASASVLQVVGNCGVFQGDGAVVELAAPGRRQLQVAAPEQRGQLDRRACLCAQVHVVAHFEGEGDMVTGQGDPVDFADVDSGHGDRVARADLGGLGELAPVSGLAQRQVTDAHDGADDHRDHGQRDGAQPDLVVFLDGTLQSFKHHRLHLLQIGECSTMLPGEASLTMPGITRPRLAKIVELTSHRYPSM
jgi:hypothetical protein